MSSYSSVAARVTLLNVPAAPAATTATLAANVQILAAPALPFAEYQVIVPWEVVRFAYQSRHQALWDCLQERSLLFPLPAPVEVEVFVAQQACDTILLHDQRQVVSTFFDDVLSCQAAFNASVSTDPKAPLAWFVSLVIQEEPRMAQSQQHLRDPVAPLVPTPEFSPGAAEMEALLSMLAYVERGLYDADNIQPTPFDLELAELFALQHCPMHHFAERRPLPTLVPQQW